MRLRQQNTSGWRRLLPVAVLVLAAPVLAQRDQATPTEAYTALPTAEPADIGALSRAVARRPESFELVRALADAYRAAARLDEARTLLENYAARHTRTDARLYLATICDQQSDWDRVVALLAPLQATLAVEPRLLLERAYHALGRHADADATLIDGLRAQPRAVPLWLRWIDRALTTRQFADALARCRKAERHMPGAAELQWRRAQAYFARGELLGTPVVRAVESGQAGQFAHDVLLVRPRGPGRFLCCPAESALYQVRSALDQEFELPAAHLMHARIWFRIGRADIAFQIIQGREAIILRDADDDTLRWCAELAIEADADKQFLDYSRQRARRRPKQHDAIMKAALLRVADSYNERGNEAVYIRFLERAVAITPDDLKLQRRLADARWHAGQRAAAAELYRFLLDHTDNHADRRRLIERIVQSAQGADTP